MQYNYRPYARIGKGRQIVEPHRRRELLKIRQSFLERYKLAKQFEDKFYTEYFEKQIRDIDEELEEKE